jgi:hypothetical protein
MTRTRAGARPLSLPAAIRAAQADVREHQATVRHGAAALFQSGHDVLTAPTTLLLASGVGFLAAEFTHRPAAAVADQQAHEPSAATRLLSPGKLLALGMDALRLLA